VKTFIDNVNTFLKNRIDDGSSFGGVFESLKGKVVNVFKSNNSTANTTADDLAISTISQNAVNSRNACLKSLSLINQGTYCLLTSQAASQFTTDFGSYAQIRANLTTVGPSLEACLPLIDATCTISYGNPISLAAVYSFNNTIATEITNATCTAFKSYANCNTDLCNASRRTLLINQIFSANTINFIPPKTTLDKFKDYFSNAVSTIKNLFNRRLATSKAVTLIADTNGEDLVFDGSSSGIAVPVASSAGMILPGVVAILLAFFA
jgi:hypothetical protein